MQVPLYISDTTWIFDIYTQKINLFKNHTYTNSLDISSLDSIIPNIYNHLLGVIKPDKKHILLIANGLIVFTDNRLQIRNAFPFSLKRDTVDFHFVGNMRNITYCKSANKLYMTVLPNFREFMLPFYDQGCLAEIDLTSFNARIIPVKHPPDFIRGKSYTLFAVPLITSNDSSVFLAFPGSNWIKKFDVFSGKLSSFYIPDVFNNTMGKSEDMMKDMVNAGIFFEFNNFYQIMANGSNLLLLYWEGRKISPEDRRKGLEVLQCSYISYSLKDKSINGFGYLPFPGSSSKIIHWTSPGIFYTQDKNFNGTTLYYGYKTLLP